MRYRLKYTDEARQAIRTAPGYVRQRTRREVEALADNPRPGHAEPMQDRDRYKIKIDRWRLIYRVMDETGVVRILRIKPRGPKTYEDIPE